MQRVEIADATADQLRQFGVVQLGLDLGGTENRRTMIGKLAEIGYNLDFINLVEVSATPVVNDAPSGAFNTRENERGEREVRITIHKQDKPGGEDHVQVGVNGRLMLIPRGDPFFVPESYVEVLKHAVELVYPEYDPSKNDGRGGLDEPRKVHAYPFSYS